MSGSSDVAVRRGPLPSAGAVALDPEHRVTRWRGRSHQLAFAVSIPAGVALWSAASTPRARLAAAVYAVALMGMFAASALYNRCLSTHRLRPWMRWLDHSMIYVLIAASYTPVCAVLAPRPWGAITLATVWSAALVGVVFKWSPLRRLRRLCGAWYVVMGWAALAILPMLAKRMTAGELTALALGGALYSVGALVLYHRRPDPSPVHFGYHEVWHGFVVAASVCHFVMSWLTVARAAALA